jgi:3-isopropylmalate/(R)-2-methylmalate dehydratase small subunit
MVEQGAKVSSVSGTGIVVRGNDIDTDRIIPARYMKVVTFDGLGEFAFRDVRFSGDGAVTDHPFNRPEYQGASILLVNKNFGCGSSREHAPQALVRWGIHAVVGESFAEIFAGNCNALGVPAVTLDEKGIGELMSLVEQDPSQTIDLDLEAFTLTLGDRVFKVSANESYRKALLSGSWDSTSVLLSNGDAIAETSASLPYTSGFARA